MLESMPGVPRLVALVLYGAGLRLTEACALRMKDVDLDRRELIVRHGKGGRDRLTMLPESLVELLRQQMEKVRALHRRDRAAGRGHVVIPDAMARKAPSAARDVRWHWVFPAARLYKAPVTCVWVRHHVHQTVIQRAVGEAAREAGYDIRTVQELLGHRDVKTAMIYTHVLNRGGERNFPAPYPDLNGHSTT